ncbi:MAG: hypothetical protein IJV14_07860 [Lachnospiraceae bacterium]|nr:hypothetical protein [Lachnospiraceae bacterium]
MKRYALVNLKGRKIGYLDVSIGLIRSRFGKTLYRINGNWLVSVTSYRTYKILSDGTIHDLDDVQVASICNYPIVHSNRMAAIA